MPGYEIPMLQTTSSGWVPGHLRENPRHSTASNSEPGLRRATVLRVVFAHLYPPRTRRVPSVCPCSRRREAHVQHSMQSTTHGTFPDPIAQADFATLINVCDNGLATGPMGWPSVCLEPTVND